MLGLMNQPMRNTPPPGEISAASAEQTAGIDLRHVAQMALDVASRGGIAQRLHGGDEAPPLVVDDHAMPELGRFAQHLTRVEVHINDVNADKGGTDKRCMIEAVVSRVWEPACVVRRIEPRVTEDRTVRSMDLHASLSDEFDPHGEEDTRLPSCSCSFPPHLRHITIIIGTKIGRAAARSRLL